jgi:hypothetical protein
MEIKPISAKLYNFLKENKVKGFELRFTGGSDEGWLDVSINNDSDFEHDEFGEICQTIEKWAWSVYEYSGAGDGSDYGDNITYDLENGSVSSEEWYMVAQHSDPENSTLEISE